MRSATEYTWKMLWSMKMADLPAARMPSHEVQELLGLLQREPHRRLVEDDDVGLEVERPDDREALALAARQPGHRACPGSARWR